MQDRRLQFVLAILVTVCALMMSLDVQAGEIDVLNSADVHVASMKELREARVVKQNYDFSCGAAAVATLLTYSYEVPTTEREAFDTMWAVGDQDHIKQYGFSLLDMQKYLASRGYEAVGYKLSMEKLRRLHVPAIALISPHGYNHFVVLRGWRNNAAIIADPRLGLRRMPAEDFQGIWNGVVFLLKNEANMGKSHYNDPQDFKLIPRSIVSDGMFYTHEDLSNTLINIPLFNDY